MEKKELTPEDQLLAYHIAREEYDNKIMKSNKSLAEKLVDDHDLIDWYTKEKIEQLKSDHVKNQLINYSDIIYIKDGRLCFSFNVEESIDLDDARAKYIRMKLYNK